MEWTPEMEAAYQEGMRIEKELAERATEIFAGQEISTVIGVLASIFAAALVELDGSICLAEAEDKMLIDDNHRLDHFALEVRTKASLLREERKQNHVQSGH